VVGVRCRDKESGRATDVYAKVVLNATGPFADQLRQLSNPATQKCMTASSGAHVTLPAWYGSSVTGMIIPKTKVRLRPWSRPSSSSCAAQTTHNVSLVSDLSCRERKRPGSTVHLVQLCGAAALWPVDYVHPS
jgi:glycerol-3-phosphate dehydrogenase